MRIGSVGMPAMQCEEVEFINEDDDSVVIPGNTSEIIIRPPQGYIYDLLGLLLYVVKPIGGTSGTHFFDIVSENQGIAILFGSSAYNTSLRYDYGYWFTADTLQYPTTEIAQLLALQNKRIDEDSGLSITYCNLTDVNQTNMRYIRLWVRKVKVA